MPEAVPENHEQHSLNDTIELTEHGQFKEQNPPQQSSEVDYETIGRLLLLRRPKSSYTDDEEAPGYCALYAVCSKHLKNEQKLCTAIGADGRLMPGLPRRRMGRCNEKLVADFQVIDMLVLRTEELFDECIEEAVKEERKAPRKFHSGTCSDEWPLLPYYDVTYTCFHRIRVVQLHCWKLAKCCQRVQRCRRQVDESKMAVQLNDLKKEVATKSAACQIHSYREYEKKRSRAYQKSSERNNAFIFDVDDVSALDDASAFSMAFFLAQIAHP
ncbi:unnamed protein product [Toxocara canis]|uniref:Uncharacterized protein n=1 Tax=Toxocara canis TaxID=6265 RepID=A0A183VCV6_TOXCA|nr:unnamed protein product [Toxocara canis]